MTTLEDVTLWAHIGTGFLALFAGLGAFLTEKGGRRHRGAGRTYVYAMAFVSGSALALLAFDATFLRVFLGLIAVFSFYFAFSGYRVLSRKRPIDDPAPVDWAAVSLFGLASVGLVGMGGWLLFEGGDFAVVILVFGGIGVASTAGDVRAFRTEPDRGAWVGGHIGKMGAAYIATVSAFSAVNFVFLPEILRWLWPTLVGTPALVYLTRKYEARFGVAA